MVGKTISHYKIAEKLGEGGMGVVYKAEDIKLGRFVALKFLPSNLISDPKAIERFINEAHAASTLEHPNICTIHEIDETEDGQFFICMAYYSGEMLSDKIKRGALEIVEAIDIATQISEGLTEAHQHRIVHRDIKPANILINKNGQVKILDFGLAKLLGQQHLTKAGQLIGTLAYTSPEQVQGESIDFSTDIWALGVVIYEMLTGQLPFKSESEVSLVYTILNEQPQPLAELRPAIPTELEKIVCKALKKRKSERFHKMEEMSSALANLKPEKEKPTNRRPRSRLVIPILILLSLAISFFIIKNVFWSSQITQVTKDSIVVMHFDNLTQDATLNWMRKGAAGLLAQGLSQSQELNILDTQHLISLLSKNNETNLSDTTVSIIEVSKKANIGTLIRGDIIKSGEIIRITTRAVDTKTGEIVLAEHADGYSDEIFSMVANLTNKFRNYLEVRTAADEVNEKWLQRITTNSVEAYRDFVLGTEYFIESDWENARSLFGQAVAVDSAFALAHVWLAAVAWITRDFNTMSSSFQSAILLRKELPLKEKLIMDLFGAATAGNYKKQIGLTKQILHINPRSKFWTFVLGQGYYFNRHYEQALDQWTELYEGRWKHLWLYYYMGRTYQKLKQVNKAITVYRTGLEVIPQWITFNAWLSAAYFLKGNSGRADEYYEYFLATLSDSRGNAGEQYREAGEMFRRVEKYDYAIECLKRSLILNPKELDSIYYLGKVYETTGDYSQAIESFETFIEKQRTGPKVEDAHESLSQLKIPH